MGRMPKIGTFYKVPLVNNKHAYARLIDKYLFSFYKINATDLSDEEIMHLLVNASPIFSIYIHKYVFSESNWEIIGYRPLEEHILNNMPVFFRQNIGNKEQCWLITLEPGYKKPIDPKDCINMEREVVWEYKTVEERLIDYFENRLNRYVEHFKVKL